MSPDDAVFDFANVLKNSDDVIATGTFASDATPKVQVGKSMESNKKESSADFDWGAPVSTSNQNSSSDFDWGTPAFQPKEPELELDLDLKISDDEESEDGIEIKPSEIPSEEVKKNDSKAFCIDIMAQQLKFIACLK
ncbi:uncharacterized protein, partial [Parasteatoda tepidariorum]|uniref:uncharacterized protein n=1 Tax=Parasteatoda tepidariorum TaxID=114398 RepID=UPI0039BC727B